MDENKPGEMMSDNSSDNIPDTSTSEQITFGFGEGEPISVGSSEPLILDNPETVWLIYEGAIDIFAIQLQDRKVSSPRHHLFRATAGQAIFGLDLEGFRKGLQILAVGVSNTRVARLERSRFEDLLQDSEHHSRTRQLLDEWISGTSQSIESNVALRQYIPLSENQVAELISGEVARPRKGVLWVKALEGSAQFVSREELPMITADDFLPVTEDTWLYALKDTRLYAIDTDTFVRKAFSWSFISNFHSIVLNSILWNLEQSQVVEQNRLQHRSEHDRLQLEDSFTRLVTILDPDYTKDVIGEDTSDHPLVAACKLVGKAMGMTIPPRPDPIDGREETIQLETITRAAGFQLRQVALRGEWWHEDNGPLLAYASEDERPVALVQSSPTRYVLLDPARQQRVKVNREVASTLTTTAYSFYRTLPNKVLNIRDLLHFGLQDAHQDLRTVLIMGIVAGALAILLPLIIGRVFDFIIPSADRSQLSQFALILLTIALTTAIFQTVQNVAVLRAELKLDNALQSAIWDRLLNLPAPFFRKYSAGDLSSRALGASTIRRTLSGTVVLTTLAGIFSIFNFVLLFYFSISLALVATVLVVVAFGVTLIVGYWQMRYQRDLAHEEGRIAGMVLQFITGISKFRVAGVEGRAFAQWAKYFVKQKQFAYSAGNTENVLVAFNATYPIIASMVVFALVVSATDLSTGEFLAFNAAFTAFLLAGLELSTALISVLRIVPTYERMKPITTTLPEVDETKSDPGELAGEIEATRLSFRYKMDGPLILGDLSFHVNPGDFVAIVGPSGSGKSTLFRLLLGFEQPESGAIFYDGQDLSGLDIRSVRQQLGVVLQNGQLMTGDIFTNIVGVAPLTLEDAWTAAEMAGLSHDIQEMPMGMHTIISEGGSTFSGGQRQRLLIARAIAKKPKILYFDEATSALDNRTQSIVSESLEKLDATRIVIAHRLSTIVHADHILVLDRGRIVQSGTYEELIRIPGMFAELARRQLV